MQFAIVVTQMKQSAGLPSLESEVELALLEAALLHEALARQNLALTMHNDLGQLLAILKIKLSLLDLAHAGLETRLVAADINRLIDQINQSFSRMIKEVCPLPLHTTALLDGLDCLVSEFRHIHGLAIHVHDDGMEKPLDETTCFILLSVVYELLINIKQHAKTSAAEIRCLITGSSVSITVADFGCGFDLSASPVSSKHKTCCGLQKIRAYISQLGGKMYIDSRLHDGTTVTLLTPISLWL